MAVQMVYYGMDELLSLSDELIREDAEHISESMRARALLLDLRVRRGIEAISERGLQAIDGMNGVRNGADAVARRFEDLGGDMDSGDNPYALTAAGVERLNALDADGRAE
jgi:hypothetical protein